MNITHHPTDGLHIDGVPALIQAGTLHYFRLPHADLWRPVLARMRMAGCNAVLVPFPWHYHSPTAGMYDFTGPRDIDRLLAEAARMGLWLIAYPGPWIGGPTLRLDAGGIPPWLFRIPAAPPRCGVEALGPSFPFLRAVWEWWERLFPHFVARDNLLAVAMDAGACADGRPLTRYLYPLVEMAKRLRVNVPLLTPLPADEGGDVGRRFVPLTPEGRITADAPGGLIEIADEAALGRAVAWGREGYIRAATHVEIAWGYWPALGSGSADVEITEVEAPIREEAGGSAAYDQMRRTTLAVASLGDVLTQAAPAEMIYASEERCLASAWSDGATTVAFLRSEGAVGETRLSLPLGDALLVTSPVWLPPDETSALPLQWPLAGGRVQAMTLPPVLRTKVAGRYLLVVVNETGGEIILSDDFRVRHTRGPVATERGPDGLVVRIDAARVASVLLDTLGAVDEPLQILALAPRFAVRVWPLDDVWRTSPAYPAAWTPDPEEPARGLVIGPEMVRPRADGGFDYAVTEKGFGYRWGPWRGSDPHTWLAPLMWRAPARLRAPELTWESRPGAPEVARAYDDRAWQRVAAAGSPEMEAQGLGFGCDYGFTWYRGRFHGPAAAVTLILGGGGQACDVFFNGEHLASLSAAPADQAAPTPKTLPLPPGLLRSQEENVLALLVEHRGRPPAWDAAARPQGLLACGLDTDAAMRWRVRCGLAGERQVQGFPGYADWELVPQDGSAHITWHRALFRLEMAEGIKAPLFLSLAETPARAYVFLNGQLVGRCRARDGGRQRFWLPAGVLDPHGENELLIAQWTRGARPGIGSARLEAGSVVRWHHAGEQEG